MRSVAAAALAATAIGLVPLWPHIVLVSADVDGIIAVFREVAIYPSDACLAALALLAAARPAALGSASRWVVFSLAMLAAAALLSAATAPDPALACGLAAQLALLALAWWGVHSLGVSRTVLGATLVASAVLESGLAAAQFVTQQTLVPSQLGLPWLPLDGSQA